MTSYEPQHYLNLEELTPKYKKQSLIITIISFIIIVFTTCIYSIPIFWIFLNTNDLAEKILLSIFVMSIELIIVIFLICIMQIDIESVIHDMSVTFSINDKHKYDKLNGIENDYNKLYQEVFINKNDIYDVKLPYHLINYDLKHNNNYYKIDRDDYYTTVLEYHKRDKTCKISSDYKTDQGLIHILKEVTSYQLFMQAKSMHLDNHEMKKFVNKLIKSREIDQNVKLINENEKYQENLSKFKNNTKTDSHLYKRIKNLKEEL